ncbi:hypothetical protein Glove_8g4 [Diversispora epigaea]|uniref:Uncharacterized protein n=1 Tax=Diversispora epigaea TaxID=1348612 RepID=A0A397JZX6_9GLOM|nr:hypothetical protein Glove_8g4 [Diversispora epigaea]
MVLERFLYLTLKHSFRNDYFEFNRLVPCPLCNKNHKKENIRDHIEGIWDSVTKMQSELDLLKQERARLLARIAELEQIVEDQNKLEVRIMKNIELRSRVVKLKHITEN